MSTMAMNTRTIADKPFDESSMIRALPSIRAAVQALVPESFVTRVPERRVRSISPRQQVSFSIVIKDYSGDILGNEQVNLKWGVGFEEAQRQFIAYIQKSITA